MPLGASRINFLSKQIAVPAVPDYTVPTSAFTNDFNTVALYHLDNNDNDSGTSGLNFTTSGGFTSGTTKFGTHAGDLTQTGDYFQYSTSGAYGPVDGQGNPRDYTLECFVYYDSLTGAAQSTYLSNLMQPLGNQAGYSFIWFGLGTDGKLKLSHYNVVNISGTTVYGTGAWHHVALTYDTSDNKYRGYCDGKLEFTTNAVTLNSANTPEYMQTYGIANAGDTDGYIDEIRISNAVRYPTYTAPTVGQGRNSIELNGSNNGFYKSSPISPNSTPWTFAGWFNTDDHTKSQQWIIEDFQNGKPPCQISLENNFINILVKDSSNNTKWQARESGAISSNTWHCLLASYNPSTGAASAYVGTLGNGTMNAITNFTGPATATFDTAMYDSAKSLGIWTRGYNGSIDFDGTVSDTWFDGNTYIDFTSSSNREKFFSSSGLPVDLGTDGSTPTGSSPDLFLSGPASSYGTNKGSGGSVTTYGTIADDNDAPGNPL